MKRDYFSRRNLISLLPLGTGLLAQGGIVIDGGDLSKSSAPFHVGAGAAEKSVKLRA